MSATQECFVVPTEKNRSQNDGCIQVDCPTAEVLPNKNSGITAEEQVLTDSDIVKLEYSVSESIEQKEHSRITCHESSSGKQEACPDDESQNDAVSYAKSEIAKPIAVYRSGNCVSSSVTKTWSCNVCEKKFTRKHNLIAHLRIHTGEKPYNCGVCGKAFRQRATLFKHERTYGHIVHKCSICSQTFLIFRAFQKHLSDHTDVSCEDVTKTSTSVSIATSSKPEKIVTEISPSCHSQYKSSVKEISQSSKHPDASLNKNDDTKKCDVIRYECHKCGICGKIFKTKRSLKCHLRIHDEKLHSCDFCDKKFRFLRSLMIHSYIHTGEKPYKCYVCGRAFRHRLTMQKHVLTHTSDTKFVCVHCEKAFNHKELLNNHLLIHDITPSGKDQEKTSAQSHNSLDIGAIHRRIAASCSEDSNKEDFITTTDGYYMCSVCGMKVKTRSTLKAHLRTHTGEKPYSCDICTNKYASAFSLKVHKRTHTGEKPFVCDFCQKAFTRAGTLKKHMSIHTGAKPFKCHICEKCFTLNNTLKKHLRKHAETNNTAVT